MKTCKRCVMDETDVNIIFDENGYCNHCSTAMETLNRYPFSLSSEEKKNKLENIFEKIKEKGKNAKYDCLIGLSGGADSSYVVHMAAQANLRPLIIHLDNGWNSPEAEYNIKCLCNTLNFEIVIPNIDLEEFMSLQVAFLKASVPDCEIPTDHAIISIIKQYAKKYNINSIISGTNYSSESILPRSWSQGHRDFKYIKHINKQFGTRKLKTFPRMTLSKQIYDKLFSKIITYDILNYIDYDKNIAKKVLSEKYGWKDYGTKHGESIYTKIFQEYILYEKFGFDKRKAHFSSQIIVGQLKREDALKELEKLPYDKNKIGDYIKFFIQKLGLTEYAFEKIMRQPNKKYEDYSNNKKIFDFIFSIRKNKFD